jgi:hypothetical protein
MTRADNTRHLVEAAKVRHDRALTRATDAIRSLERVREPVTFSSVARAAAVSRGWLYRNPELREAIAARRPAHPSSKDRSVPLAQRASAESLRQRADALRERIARVEEENAELRERVARLYGERRIDQLLSSVPRPLRQRQ